MSKNLANCRPTEFMAQAYRIKKRAEKWMKDVGIAEIRKRKPEIEPIPSGATDEEKAEIEERNRKSVAKTASENVSMILDAAMDKHAAETLELLALACFVEPQDVDNHKVSFYLRNLSEIVSDEDVLAFFTSLAQLDQTGFLKA